MFLPHTWNNGIMEYWNVDFKRNFLIYWVLFQGEFSQFTLLNFPVGALFNPASAG